MKKICMLLSSILVVAIMFTMLSVLTFLVNAEELETFEEGNFTYTIENEEVTIIGFSNNVKGEVVIPETLGKNTVRYIARDAFRDCFGITSITIPKSVRYIYPGAFSWCNIGTLNVDKDNKIYHSEGNCIIQTESKYLAVGCKNSAIPSDGSVTIIGDSAFTGCNFSSITIPDTIVAIFGDAFGGCANLRNLTIPDSVIHIDGFAFHNCFDLVKENNGLSYVDKWLMSASTTKTNVIIPSYTVGIAAYAFSNNSTLTDITIPSNIKSIGINAFSNCKNLTTIKFNENSNLEIIGEGAFVYCSNLTNIDMPNSVIEIGVGAFKGCRNLTDITLSKDSKLQTIHDEAFLNCRNLAVIAIPESVTSIGSNAFGGCTKLIEEQNGISYLDTWIVDADTTIYTSVSISSNITGIASGAFNYCTNLTDITFEENSKLKIIGKNAFYECETLENIIFPNTLTSIGDMAFFGCKKLTSIVIPENVTEMGNGAFFGCTELTDVVISGSVNKISDSAFGFCSKIDNITLPDSVTSIGVRAFEKCTNLKNITIPNNVTDIHKRAFEDCNEALTVQCYKDSAAHTYAVENNIKFVLLDTNTDSNESGSNTEDRGAEEKPDNSNLPEETTTTDKTTDESGCKSSVAGSALFVAAVICCGTVFVPKKKN